MNERTHVSTASCITTHDVLLRLGFCEDGHVLSDEWPGQSLEFGNFKLEASGGVNRWLRPVVVLGGVMATERTVALVHFEMPGR